jgi:predicted CXXCH cytochrome family protein
VLLKNKLSGDSEKAAEVVVVATNAPPEALPVVIAGPDMPQKTPDGRPKQGTGHKTVTVGDKVFLAGWALDKNMPAPELYNAQGRKADTYGKNDDWAMRQYGWHWKLERTDGTGNRADETAQLKANGKDRPTESEFPWFVAEKPGEYVATLVVDDRDPGGSLSSAPQGVVIKVLAKENAMAAEATCTATNGCHAKFTSSRTAANALASGHTCQSCHGPGQAHLAAADAAEKAKTMESPAMPGLCGRCHQEYGEWEKARHSDAYPFGYNEIPPPLLLNCAKCHYAKGFAEVTATSQAQKVPFGEIEFKKEAFPGGPKVVFDFTKLPKKMGESVSCQSCHDVHQITKENPQGLRMPKSDQCGTCHEEKWQNVLLERTAGKVGSSYEYPGEAYESPNPHNTEDKCVLCHMSKASEKKDQNGVRLLGGHTMRMREAGADGRVGGFGPRPDDPTALREQFSKDDTLNMAVCQRCHPGAASYDINGRQTEIYKLWNQLGKLLKERNSGLLPGYKPGDKCATCHRGGTLPFDKDPHMVLENAYTNYKLIMNDRSWGVHNYKYSKKLLEDSIKSVEANYPFN